MQDNTLKGFCFLSTKFITGVLFYFFYQYIQEGNNLLIYLFISLYLIERIISMLYEKYFLHTNKLESLVLILLNLIQLDEFYFMINHKKFPGYLSNGIYIQCILTYCCQIPLYIMTNIWVLGQTLTTLYITLLTFINMAFFTLPFFLVIIGLRLDNDNNINNLINVFFNSQFHFFSFFWSVVLLYKQQDQRYFLLGIYFVICLLFFKSIWKRIKNISQYTTDRYYYSFLIISKQTFHIVIQYKMISTFRFDSITLFGQKIFNNMTIFEFTFKLYLLTQYSIHYFSNQLLEDPLKDFYLVLLIALLLSIVILGYYICMHIVNDQIIQNEIIEYDSMQEFEDTIYLEQKLLDNKPRFIEIFEKQFSESSDHLGNIIKLFLLENGKSEIRSQKAQRQKIMQNSEYQEVNFQYKCDKDLIIKAIGNRKILPQIKRIYFTLSDQDEIIDIYKYFIGSHIDVQINTNLDVFIQDLKKFKQTIPVQIESYCAQYLIFQKNIKKEINMNPSQILYDLFD